MIPGEIWVFVKIGLGSNMLNDCDITTRQSPLGSLKSFASDSSHATSTLPGSPPAAIAGKMFEPPLLLIFNGFVHVTPLSLDAVTNMSVVVPWRLRSEYATYRFPDR